MYIINQIRFSKINFILFLLSSLIACKIILLVLDSFYPIIYRHKFSFKSLFFSFILINFDSRVSLTEVNFFIIYFDFVIPSYEAEIAN